MKSIKVCAITGSRAEYSIFYPVLLSLKSNKNISLKIITHGMHHSAFFGNTFQEIENDGFEISFKAKTLDERDSSISACLSSAQSIEKLSPYLEKLAPDIVLVVGDRYETHAAVLASLLLNIPIAHIHGGEISMGAIDEQLRHSITKMSHLHFCSTEIYKKRLIQMGEHPQTVFNVGAPALDNIKNIKPYCRSEIQKRLNWPIPEKFALVTYHPETIDSKNIEKKINSILSALVNMNMNAIFTYANADHGGKKINEIIELFCKNNPEKYKIVKNLGVKLYLSLMKICEVVIGNSSSGIIEAATFYKPVINIGDRQNGRVKGLNIIDCSYNEIEKSYDFSKSEEFIKSIKTMKNPYGSGDSAQKITNILIEKKPKLKKIFYDINY